MNLLTASAVNRRPEAAAATMFAGHRRSSRALVGMLMLGLLTLLATGGCTDTSAPIAGATVDGGITVTDAWVRAAPPGAPMLAAYITVRNDDAQTVQVTAMSSDLGGDMELHETRMVEGVARMRRVDPFEIPAGGEVSMAPGGMHLMIHGAQRVPAAGETVTMQLELSDGRMLEYTASVRQGK